MTLVRAHIIDNKAVVKVRGVGGLSYGVCSNLASSGEPLPLLHKTTLTNATKQPQNCDTSYQEWRCQLTLTETFLSFDGHRQQELLGPCKPRSGYNTSTRTCQTYRRTDWHTPADSKDHVTHSVARYWRDDSVECCFITARHVVAHRAGQRTQTATKQHSTLVCAGHVCIHHWLCTIVVQTTQPTLSTVVITWRKQAESDTARCLSRLKTSIHCLKSPPYSRTNSWQRM